jgi:hypothetical protein
VPRFVFTLNGRRTRVKRLRRPSIWQRGVFIWRWNPNGWIWQPVPRLLSVWICSCKVGNFACACRPPIYVAIVRNECRLRPSKRPPSLKSTPSDAEIVAPSIRDVFALMTSRVDGAFRAGHASAGYHFIVVSGGVFGGLIFHSPTVCATFAAPLRRWEANCTNFARVDASSLRVVPYRVAECTEGASA